MYLNNENNDFINYIKKHTNCSELKKFIDGLPIIRFSRRNDE